MQVSFVFLTDTIHIPPRTRQWPQISKPVKRGDREFEIALAKPVSMLGGTHLLDGDTQKVTDAQIPISVTGEWVDSDEYFKEIVDLVLEEGGQLIELLRIETRQSELRLRGLRDMVIRNVRRADGDLDILQTETVRFEEWFKQSVDKPLPNLDRTTWITFWSKHQGQRVLPSVHESLLLDAELALESDPRIAIMFSALSCEVFIQGWLSGHGTADERLKRWLAWANPTTQPEKSVSVRTYFDLGLFLAIGQSLMNNEDLWKRFNKLFDARNDVVHRGKLKENYRPHHAVETARDVIGWVRGLDEVTAE